MLPLSRVKFRSLAGCALLAIVAAPLAVQAQEATPLPHDHDPHAEANSADVIVVTVGGIERLDMLAGTSVMDSAQLQRSMAGQVGEVLEQLPGVSATGFAPGASRPVLRGFQGERVRVLVDGIGAIDASNTSADHAVTIDPLTAESIEVLRGPAVLLYGSSAIGGAVNVIDRRIPHSIPRDGLRFDAVLAGDTANNLREGGASLDIAVAPSLVWHADGSWRRTGDVTVPGFTLSPALRADLLADAEEELEEGHGDEAAELVEKAALAGTVPDSAARALSLGTGFTLFSGLNSFGASVGYYDTRYGVPISPDGGHAHGEEEEEEETAGLLAAAAAGGEEEPVSIDLRQFRADLRGEFHIGEGLFHDLVTRWGYSDYTHTELEGSDVGTTFKVEGVEGRVELIQSDHPLAGGVSNGSVGAQYFYRDFVAIGAEAFVPPNTSEQFSLFALQELRFGPFEAELGARWEHTANAANGTVRRTFDGLSGALGLSWTFDSGIRAGLNLSRAERAPSSEELFADGPHIATSQYELGDPDLLTERAWGVEAYARAEIGTAALRVAAYRNWFDRFIYLSDTGLEEDGLPLFAFLQQDARWAGLEAELTMPLWSQGDNALVGEVSGSAIRATLADGSPVPRIPPFEAVGALEWQGERLDLRAELEWFGKQDRVALYETPTDSFAHVNLAATFRPFGNQRLSLLVQADNVFDAEGRRHASYTKDFVPLPGRNFKVSLRTSF